MADVAGDSRMMKGYLDTPGGRTAIVDVSDLPSNIVNAGFDVYVYSDSANSTSTRNSSAIAL